ncbi:MAG: MGMT family protein [Chloroflexi bacterium]|nr:MGMT family protein [Chloroflexota bacterium]
MDALTPFTREVLDETARVPWGEVCSYQELAARVGRPMGARAAGQALGRNPVPIAIPCHRVVSASGGLGGFGGGLCWKRKLLKLEGLDPDRLQQSRMPEAASKTEPPSKIEASPCAG